MQMQMPISIAIGDRGDSSSTSNFDTNTAATAGVVSLKRRIEQQQEVGTEPESEQCADRGWGVNVDTGSVVKPAMETASASTREENEKENDAGDKEYADAASSQGDESSSSSSSSRSSSSASGRISFSLTNKKFKK